MPPSLQTIPLTVTFDPANLLAPITISEEEVRVPQGLSFITVTLQTLATPGQEQAVFQTSPIQWFDPDNPDVPILPPTMFVVQRISDQFLTLLDFNSVPAETSHRFNIVVAYGGNTYGSDPVIVNEPPG